MAKLIEMENKLFGNWFVLHRDTEKKSTYYVCECMLCGNTFSVSGMTLRNGDSTCCKNCSTAKKREDLTGKSFGLWKVKSYAGTKNGHTYWLCECACENKTLREVDAGALKNGHSTSCGCTNRSRHIELAGQQIGDWTVLRYDKTENNLAYWWCKCTCGVERSVSAGSLLNNRSLSCGHKTDIEGKIFGQLTAIQYQGLLGKNQDQPAWLCECSCGKKITVFLGNLTSGQTTSCGHNQGISYKEKEVSDYIKSLNISIIENDRTILNGKELDIYLPKKQLAIEFNGVYWHSTQHKPNDYHIQKTFSCNSQGIHLIHIWEYEWLNVRKQKIIKSLLKNQLDVDLKIIYARNTVVKQVNLESQQSFLNDNHLQGYTPCTEALGLYYNNELIQVMTFGKPRFNREYDTELLRLCAKMGYKIVGGASKLFNHYIKSHNTESIISYCDISKFTGKVYEQIGMTYDGLTVLNYCYVRLSHDTYDIKSRYQCQKHKLIEQGYGTENQTEEEIMYNRGYYKVYDCGNKRYVYKPKKQVAS